MSPDKSLSFAFSVPEDEDNDFYFTLRVHRDFSWGAVGLGTDDMPGALIFMIYDNRNGESVTFSPRLANGHYEPQYYPQLEVDELPGTGIISEKYMVYQGRCRKNCRTWPLRGNTFGSIDVNSTTQKAIWALGMMEDFASDKPWQGIKYHQQYGTFTIDMARTHGATEPPTLDGNSRNEGTTLDIEHVNKSDVQSTMHAVFMILAIVGLMPLAVVLLRLGGAVRWHALIQAISLVFLLAGLAMGVMTSFRYTRVIPPTKHQWKIQNLHVLTCDSPKNLIHITRFLASYSQPSSSANMRSAFSIIDNIGRLALCLNTMLSMFGLAE